MPHPLDFTTPPQPAEPEPIAPASWPPLVQACVDFVSRLVATFIAVFIAGLLLLVITRLYVGWEIGRFQDKIKGAFIAPPPFKFDDPFIGKAK